jgi:hypothetical protein
MGRAGAGLAARASRSEARLRPGLKAAEMTDFHAKKNGLLKRRAIAASARLNF